MAQQPLTAWQKLRVQAAAGLPIKVGAEMLRAIAKAGEQLDVMVEMNGRLLEQRGELLEYRADLQDALRRALKTVEQHLPLLAAADRLIDSNARLRHKLLIWQIIAVLLGACWLADMAGLI